jgi:anti-sigma B factor antagonist
MRQKCEVRNIGPVAVLDLYGNITIGNGDAQLRQAVNDQLDRGVRYLLVNLGGVKYMDAAGIVELVTCYKRVQARRGLIRLISPSDRIHDILTLTRIGEAFEILRDEKEALASLAGSSGDNLNACSPRSAVAPL